MDNCKYCHQDKEHSDSCLCIQIKVDGEVFQPIKYGDEIIYTENYIKLAERCPVCNVKIGGYHHPGCTYEQCPICDMPIVYCGCVLEEWEE